MRGYEDNNSVARVLKKIYWGLFIVGALGGLSATFSSVSAVVTNTPLDPVASILVLSEAALLYLAVVILAVTIAYEESGVNAATLRSVRRSQARKAARQGRHEAEDS
jgi:hypothetical protein